MVAFLLRRLRDVRIGLRLAIGFGSIMLIFAAVAVLAAGASKMNRDHLRLTTETARAKETLASAMKSSVLEQSRLLRGINLQESSSAMQREEARLKEAGRNYDDLRERFLKLELSVEERSAVESLAKLDKEIDAPIAEVVSLSSKFLSEDAGRKITGTVDPIFQKSIVELDRLLGLQREQSRKAMEAAEAGAGRVTMLGLASVGLVLVLSSLIAWIITRSITTPLGESVAVARRVASGDLTARVDAAGRDEAAELLGALKEMNSGLGQMVERIRSGAESISVGAGEVAAGNQSLASRTEEHASSLEQTASTLEEFAGAVRQNADHAKQASELAAGASNIAERGGAAVGSVVKIMGDVTSSSKRISDIVGVIDHISFQTNILALNAAVEAARAGEQGRGFAVVAAEVRSLAQRSASSAKEIRGLIETSVEKVEASARLVDQAGKTMDELVASVKRVSSLMAEIAAASNEQSSGIEQINKAITQMDSVVQMNASLVEQATAAATSMEHQAQELSQMVSQFKTGEAGASTAALPSRATAVVKSAAVRRDKLAAPARGADQWEEF